jgi:formylmethanofuran dehydrogenase subunit E
MFEVEENALLKHEGHEVAIRVAPIEDEERFITLECDTCGEYIIE